MTDVYVFTQAPDKDRAVAAVESWLEDYCGREFFEGFNIRESSVIPIASLSSKYIKRKRNDVDEVLSWLRQGAEEAQKAGNKFNEGWMLKRAGNILCEGLCEDMPWFNMEHWDWTVPESMNAHEVSDKDWYAVMVEFC